MCFGDNKQVDSVLLHVGSSDLSFASSVLMGFSVVFISYKEGNFYQHLCNATLFAGVCKTLPVLPEGVMSHSDSVIKGEGKATR